MFSEPKVGMTSGIIRPVMSCSQALHRREARRADAHAVGRAAAVGHQVEAELAVARLGVRVTSPAGTLMPSITILKCWMVPSIVV
jgi:hypothetical protein